MRRFLGGATRDNADSKPEFAGYLSPIVLRRYAKYMLSHQIQADGTKRTGDNWKKGMPRRVYLESLLRHYFDLTESLLTIWEEVTGDRIPENPLGDPYDPLEDSLCAMLFNVQGLLREVLLERDIK